MNIRALGKPLTAILITSLTGFAVPTFAATDQLMEEVVVTARKREEKLQDVPGSAAALSSDFIEAAGGISELGDLTDLITGITINETDQYFLAEPSVRGAGQSRNRASVSATGLYRNGAYFATNGLGGKNFSRMDSYDIGRVEVLRGPQGALYGRNALGGAINMISKRPGDQFDVELGYAAHISDARDLSRYDIKMDVPLGDRFAARIAHLREKYDKGYKRDINGEYLDDDEYSLSRISLRYQPSDALAINYSFDTENTESYPSLTSRFGTEALRGFTRKDQNYFVNTAHTVDYDVDNHNLVIDYRMESGVFTSVTNVRTRDMIVFQDTDHTLANANTAMTRQWMSYVDSRGDSLFQELRFVADANANLQWLVGADFYQVDYDEFIDTGAGQSFVTESTRKVEVDQRSWAIYGSADYTLDNLPLTLSAEVRYAVDEIDGSAFTLLPSLPASLLPPYPGGGYIFTDLRDNPTFSNLPYTLTASWSLNQEMLLYGKFANSYRHGGLNLAEGQPDTDPYPALPTYGAESADSLEFGYKSTWFDRRLTVNAAAFYIWYKDFLDTATNGCNLDLCVYFDPQTGESLGYNPDGTPVTVDPDGNAGVASGIANYIDNVGEVEAWGIELETITRIRVGERGHLRLNLGWSRQMGHVESVNQDATPASQLLDGADLNVMRPKAIKASALYRHDLGVSGGVFGGLTLVTTLTYTLEQGGLLGLAVNPTPLQDVRAVNAVIGLEANNWSLMLRGRNVTDYEYDRWRNGAANYLHRPNDPKEWTATFRWHLR
jgi:iron complex outermembrane recepter protein